MIRHAILGATLVSLIVTMTIPASAQDAFTRASSLNLAQAANSPPYDTTIERATGRPMLSPSSLVEKNCSKNSLRRFYRQAAPKIGTLTSPFPSGLHSEREVHAALAG